MKQNTLKILVPVIAAIVLIESVMLISGLQKKKEVTGNAEVTPVVTEVKNTEPAVYNVELSSNKSEFKKGEKGHIKVVMNGETDRNIDSINVYVKYDPSAINVPKLDFDKKLPKPVFNKVSTTRGLLVANFLISEAPGMKLSSGENLTVMEFDFVPNKSGNFDFEISTGNEMKESATMIVESATSKVLPFSSNKLTIKVNE